MHALNLLGLLFVAVGSTRSLTIESEPGEDNRLGSCQANVAPRIAYSTFSDAMSPSPDCVMFDGEKKQASKLPVFKYSTTRETKSLQGNSLLAFDVSNKKHVAQVGERSWINEWDSSTGSKIDASHINIDSQESRQVGEKIVYAFDLNLPPIDSETLPSKDFRETLMPANSNAQEFGESFSKDSAEWDSSTGSKMDASDIIIDSQQLRVEEQNVDCLNDSNRIPINSEILPSKDFRKNLVPANKIAHELLEIASTNLADRNPSESSSDAWRISTDSQQSILSLDGKNFDSRIDFHQQTINLEEQHDNFGSTSGACTLEGLEKVWPLINWDLDQVKDYDSLCVFLGKEPNPAEVEFHDSVAMSELLLVNKSAPGDTFVVGQFNIDVPQRRIIEKASSTLQKLILISNFVLTLVSSSVSLDNVNHEVLLYLKLTCTPVLHCLIICCGNDIHLFQTQWGPCFDHRNFQQKRCHGHGSYHTHWKTIISNPDERHQSDSMDLEAIYHAVLISIDPIEKLNLCKQFIQKYRSSGLVTHSCFRNFFYRSAKPIWGCWVYHCRQDTKVWIGKWGRQFKHSRFSTTKCHGSQIRLCESNLRPFDIPARLTLRRKKTIDILKRFSEVLEEYEQFLSAKTTSTRPVHPELSRFIGKCVRPVLNCLSRHCAGDISEFVRRWGKSIAYNKFSRKCCPGAGPKGSDHCQYDLQHHNGTKELTV